MAAAASSDLVLICAGSAKGTHDYTFAVLSEIGEMIVPELRHGPGKQFSLYKVNNVPVIGLPGPPHGTDLISQLYVTANLKIATRTTPAAALLCKCPINGSLRQKRYGFCGSATPFH